MGGVTRRATQQKNNTGTFQHSAECWNVPNSHCGKFYIKRRALTGTFRLGPNAPLVRFHNLLGYVETVTRGMHIDLDGIFAAAAFSKEVFLISLHTLAYSNTLW